MSVSIAKKKTLTDKPCLEKQQKTNKQAILLLILGNHVGRYEKIDL